MAGEPASRWQVLLLRGRVALRALSIRSKLHALRDDDPSVPDLQAKLLELYPGGLADADLDALVQQGRDAFCAKFIERIQTIVFNATTGWDNEEREELRGEVVKRVLKSLYKIDGVSEAPDVAERIVIRWISTILRHALADWRDREEHQPQVVPLDGQEEELEDVSASVSPGQEAARELLQWLLTTDQLSATEQTLATLLVNTKALLSNAEYAVQMGTTPVYVSQLKGDIYDKWNAECRRRSTQ